MYNYQEKLDFYQQSLSELRRKINLIVLLRLSSFLGIAAAIYFLIDYPIWNALIPILMVVIFVYLISVHARMDHQKQYLKSMVFLLENEIKSKAGTYGFNDGKEYLPEWHAYVHDMDLLGAGGFFHKINRTCTLDGERILVNRLLSNDIERISEKQHWYKELSEMVDFRFDFLAKAKIKEGKITVNQINAWFKDHNTIIPKWLLPLMIVFPIISVVNFVLLGLDIISAQIFLINFIAGLVITGIFLKNIQKFNSDINNILEIIKTNRDLLSSIENLKVKSNLGLELQNSIASKEKPASSILKSLSKKVDLYNNRNNLIIGIFGNALFLWDIISIYRIEQWINEHKDKVKDWFEATYTLDADISLANFIYNHPDYVFPEIFEEKETTVLESAALGHPLINSAKRVDNPVDIAESNFLIITGANMAGKSTYLRSVGLAIIMSNLGLTVCAKSLKYRPIPLISSMRTADSLNDDESYFYAELKRLKYIIDVVKSRQHFIILDEILKGTNSKDKEEGSKKFVEKLIRIKATGIIATHDLGLCTISEQYDEVKNYYFDAEIENDELHFDYSMKNGVCKNMNASFLLKKMEIVD